MCLLLVLLWNFKTAGLRNELGNELLQDGEVKRGCRDVVNANGEDEKKGQASAEEKMFWASDNYNTDMSQTDSGAVTDKECE